MIARPSLTRSAWLLLRLLSLLPITAVDALAADVTATAAAQSPKIAIIIDDLGNVRQSGERAVALEGPVALAILPHTPYGPALAERAHAAGKEVLLHLPLEPVDSDGRPMPGQISLTTSRDEFKRILNADLDSVPFAVGVNTHMGSLITRHPGHMSWLMEELLDRGDLFFVDSYTTEKSVALILALEHGLPATRRHVFLDNVQDYANVEREFSRLKNKAREQGFAIGIGHPYTVTLSFLEQALAELEDEGIELVPVSRAIDLQLGEFAGTNSSAVRELSID